MSQPMVGGPSVVNPNAKGPMIQPMVEPMVKPVTKAEPKPLVIPPPVAPKPAPEPHAKLTKEGGDSVTMETDDGFTTFRVAGTDKKAVSEVSKEAADNKKKCGCDCGPTGEPSAAEQVKK